MNDKIKESFDQIQAEEDLKIQTKAYLFRKTKGYTKHRFVNYRHLIPAAACLLLFFLGGHWLYFTPTVEISIDVNPSIELGVNRFDRIISVNGYNEDGQELADSLDIQYMNYSDAINQILSNENITALLSDNAVMTICVIGQDGEQSSSILSHIESCTSEENNTYCYYAHEDEVEDAHASGLSYGKYRAYLELQSLDPDISLEEVQGMTMREIHDLMESLSQEHEKETSGDDNSGNSYGYGHHQSSGGDGHGHRNGHD